MKAWAAISLATSVAHKRLLDGLDDCATVQAGLLKEILSANAVCAFGQRYGFERLHDPDTYRQTVPLCGYEDIAFSIAHGSAGSLLAEQVLLFEETGGSSGGAKLIPYTQRSLNGFRNAVQPWLYDLADWLPDLGRGYFAISPAARPGRTTPAGVPIGGNGDGIYFGEGIGRQLDEISIVPEAIAGVSDLGHWQHLTLLYLLSARDLSFLSVWSPTFITSLLDDLPAKTEALLRALHDGLEQPVTGASPLKADPSRAREVSDALAGDRLDTTLLWPGLQLMSTWTHAGAARFVPALEQLFPNATIQGKGLLATEGVVSVPLHAYRYPVLAVNSGFFEFLDDAGQSCLAHEVRLDHDYELVMSVPGLYRYRNGDRVRIRGKAGKAPQLEFIGRGNLVSDLVGEKLSEPFVGECLRSIHGFAMLAPALAPYPHYQLFVEDAEALDPGQIEQLLKRNPQYAYARALGQLEPVELVEVDRPLQCYQAFAMAQGQRLGDVKPPTLRPETDWEARMRS